MPQQDSLIETRPPWLPAALAAIGRHQFLTARQVAALVETPAAEVGTALDGLVAERALARLRPASAVAGGEPDPAYALTRQGARLVAQATGHASPRVPNAKKSLYMLAHELARNELGVVVELLHHGGALKLLRWETARARIGDVVQLAEGGRVVRVPLVADALAIVEIGGRTSALLVEIDMGTIGIPRMRTKFAGYLAWWRAGGPERRLGLRSLRVVTIAPNEKRLARLREAAMEATGGRGSGLFWFGEQRAVSVDAPARLLEPRWARAGREDTPAALFAHDRSRPEVDAGA